MEPLIAPLFEGALAPEERLHQPEAEEDEEPPALADEDPGDHQERPGPGEAAPADEVDEGDERQRERQAADHQRGRDHGQREAQRPPLEAAAVILLPLAHHPRAPLHDSRDMDGMPARGR